MKIIYINRSEPKNEGSYPKTPPTLIFAVNSEKTPSTLIFGRLDVNVPPTLMAIPVSLKATSNPDVPLFNDISNISYVATPFALLPLYVVDSYASTYKSSVLSYQIKL